MVDYPTPLVHKMGHLSLFYYIHRTLQQGERVKIQVPWPDVITFLKALAVGLDSMIKALERVTK